jgi:hypothetical protein
MKKWLMGAILFCCLLQITMAQDFNEREDIYLARVGLKILELEMQGALSLWFTDADSGRPIQGALVAIEAGSTTTNEDGLAIFPAQVLKNGENVFIFQKEGYVTTRDTFNVILGTIFFNKYSIPQIMQIDHIKIILDWGASPADLDAHLVKDNGYHISYRNTVTSSDNTAWLDRDAMYGYGPETITITQLDNNATYHCYIHNYTDRNTVNNLRLSNSKAVVRIYINNRFHISYPIETGNAGTTWHVFDIVNGEIRPVRRFE